MGKLVCLILNDNTVCADNFPFWQLSLNAVGVKCLKKFKLISPKKILQKGSVDKAIKLVKMGKIKEAEKAIKPAVNYLIKMKCKKIILGCTELPIAIFAFKSFKKIKLSKTFLDPNLILANVSMKKYKNL